MSVRYSYDNYTTRGHGVIEYTDPHASIDGPKKRKQHAKINPKLATRWPSPAPLKKARPGISKKNEAKLSSLIDRQCWKIFKQRYPGQLPQKGQMKAIRKEVLKNYKSSQLKDTNQPPAYKKKVHSRPLSKPITPELNIVNELANAKFSKLHPGQKPTDIQLRAMRHEIAEGRKKLGL